MFKTCLAAAALGLAATAASGATLDNYDVRFVVTNGPRIGDNDLALQAGAEFSMFGITFDMISGSEFSISWVPGLAHSDLYVYISDLRFAGISDPADITSLTLVSGLEPPVYSVIADAPDTAFGAPAMQFNIDRDGSFDGGGGSTWTFAYTTDVAPIPLPASLPLLLAGLGGLAWLGRRKG